MIQKLESKMVTTIPDLEPEHSPSDILQYHYLIKIEKTKYQSYIIRQYENAPSVSEFKYQISILNFIDKKVSNYLLMSKISIIFNVHNKITILRIKVQVL